MQEQNYEETTKSFDELLRSVQRSYVKDTTKDRAICKKSDVKFYPKK